ncbi:uncharacterized protein LOC141606108 [Silene latifolia]|uniref:uncharacterized protein LOC141606108 n=1 Tax=Silene latifolia TaxID=37657 RepID=UPI003D775AFB
MTTTQSATCLNCGWDDDCSIHNHDGWDGLPCDYIPNHAVLKPNKSLDDYYKLCLLPDFLLNKYGLPPLPDDKFDYNPDYDVGYFDNSQDDFDKFDEYRLEPFSAPPYFKRDHPDDDLFLKQLGDAQVPWRTQLKNYPKHADEPLIKDIVALIIWQDTKHHYFWEELHKLSPPDQDDSLYSHVIRKAASLVYFLYTQANLFKIGHERTMDKQLDIIFTEAEKWCAKGTPIDEACKLLIQLTADKDDFSFVTEDQLADMLCFYDIDISCKKFHRLPTVKVILPSTDKDRLFEDITKVVRKVELPPTELKADEYTHWMMMLLREEVTQVESNLICQAIGDHPMVKLPPPSEDNNPMNKRAQSSEDELLFNLFSLLLNLLVKAKNRMKQELLNVVQPLYALIRLHQCEVCTEISETIQVADLRRMSLGSRFIGRSHLIWAFYKLGYALPLEIRNMINIFDSDEDHPPYHIYMAALKLALQSGGEKMMQLDHFIYAVLNSKDIDFDEEQQWTEFYQDFKDFQQALENMETEVEPKSTVTVRPCESVNVFPDSSNDSNDSQERIPDFEPCSSENSSTDTGDAEDSII